MHKEQLSLSIMFLALCVFDVILTLIGWSNGYGEYHPLLSQMLSNELYLWFVLIKLIPPLIVLVVSLNRKCRVNIISYLLFVANVWYAFVVGFNFGSISWI